VQKQDKLLAAISAETIVEIIQMALSDHVSFEQIRALHGLGPNEVQALMKRQLKRASCVAWRKRVRAFTQRRAFYKRPSSPNSGIQD